MVLARHPFLSAMRVPSWSILDPRTIITAAGIAALSAAAMFMSFVLAEQASPTSGISHESVTAPPIPKPATLNDTKLAAQALQRTDLTSPAVADTAQNQPLSFTLMRSRHTEKIGPFTLRLLKTDVRHSSCSLAVIDENGKVRYHRLRTKESLHLPDSDTKTELTVTKVGRDRIQGVVTLAGLTKVSFHSKAPKTISPARG